ncbi:MAG: HEAT repeat domain-containing protein [Chloroflexota bacterium]
MLQDNQIDTLLTRLKNLFPIPDDEIASREFLTEYEAIFDQLETQPDLLNRLDVVPVLVEAFGNGGGYGLYWLPLHLLEKFDSPQVYPVLIEALQSGSAGSRKWAAYMLGRGRDKSAIPYLELLLGDPETAVRETALQALEMIRGVQPEE